MRRIIRKVANGFKNGIVLQGTSKKCFLPLVTVITFFATVGYWNCQAFVLALECDGKTIVNVSDEKTYEETKKILSKQLPSNEKSKVERIQFKITPVVNDNEVCESPNDARDKILESSQENFVEACGVYVNGELVAVGKDKKLVELAIKNVIEKEKLEDPEIMVEMSETPDLICGLFAPEDVLSDEDLEKKLFNELVTFLKCFKFESEERELPFYTEKKENENELKTWSRLLQQGETGKEIVSYKVEYKDGLPISRIQVDCETVREPKPQIVEVGTKVALFAWPVSFTKKITSPYGKRGTGFHGGIDIACSGIAGKDIVASQDGVVAKVSAGSTGYGNCVVIKHADGFETVYAHCCKVYVRPCQQVRQGDVIATVGSTGDSSGPHLHFEIRKNGNRVNPETFFE